MRDTKSLLLLLVSLLLVLVSFVLVLTWGYNFYKRNEDAKNNLKSVSVDSAKLASLVRDSLQKIYTATLQDIDIQFDSTLNYSDSLKAQLDYKLAEFYRLRSEIADMLKNRNSNTNFNVAQQKISELQTRVDDLKVRNEDVDDENRKLNEVINQIGNKEKKDAKAITNPLPVVERMGNISASVFVVSDIKLIAISSEDDNETNKAEKTDKFAGSFTVTNFNSQVSNASMEVVILKPDGSVIKGSGWDSGTFTTADGKRKIYSYKLSFSYNKAELKHLQFSVKDNNLKSGSYTMEVYYNGLEIGRLIKTLS